jgi:hypothetical protein
MSARAIRPGRGRDERRRYRPAPRDLVGDGRRLHPPSPDVGGDVRVRAVDLARDGRVVAQP